MTVEELMAKLATLPPTAKVLVMERDGDALTLTSEVTPQLVVPYVCRWSREVLPEYFSRTYETAPGAEAAVVIR